MDNVARQFVATLNDNERNQILESGHKMPSIVLAVIRTFTDVPDEKQMKALIEIDRKVDHNTAAQTISTDKVLKTMAKHQLKQGSSLNDAQIRQLSNSLKSAWLVQAEVREGQGGYQIDYEVLNHQGELRSTILSGTSLHSIASQLGSQLAGLWNPDLKALQYEIFSHDPIVNENYAKGMALHHKGEDARAMAYFELCLQEDPNFIWAGFQLAQSKMNKSEIGGAKALAMAYLEKARTQGDRPLEALLETLSGDIALCREDKQAHIHVETCFPLNQKIRGNVPFDVDIVVNPKV